MFDSVTVMVLVAELIVLLVSVAVAARSVALDVSSTLPKPTDVFDKSEMVDANCVPV